MLMLYRNLLRAILNTTEATKKIQSIASDALSFVFLTTDSLYLGFPEKFATRYFVMGQVNSNAATLTVEYWTGSVWASVEDLTDETAGLTSSGWLSWKNVSGWQKKNQSPIVNELLYWIRIKTSANFSTGTTIQAILNLFCDANSLAEFYPELVSDTRYLPPGRSTFNEQFNAGKNMVVQALIQKEMILDESQILVIDEVKIPAVHATAYCILNGIPNPSEDIVDRKTQAMKDMYFWIDQGRFSFDMNKTGDVEEQEKSVGTLFWPRR